jgi:hypothetical protein
MCPNAAFRTGPSEDLPDCRAYEQVSPVVKSGYDAVPRVFFLQYPAEAAPSSELPELAYMSNGSFAGALGNLSPDAHLSVRTPTGWQTSELTPATPQPSPFGHVGYDFSEDLSQAVLKVPGQALTPLPGGDGTLTNLFLRHANGSYSLVNTQPPSELAPAGAECQEFVEACLQLFDLPAFAGASSNFEHVLFEANDSLAGTSAPGGFVNNLYESASGQLRLVGILPDGSVAAAGAVAGAGGSDPVRYNPTATEEWSDVSHAISASGERVLFEAAADGGGPDPSQNGMTELYDRLAGAETVEVSTPAVGAAPTNPTPEPSQFWAASSDGATVFFTSSAELTSASNTGTANNSQDLYRYDVEDPDALSDLTVDTNPSDAATGAGVEGVVGASDDGSYVYFVATGQLVGGKGVDGQPNLYVSHSNTPTGTPEVSFIATLSEADYDDWTSIPVDLDAYVTPDGRHVAFMSRNSLTGYPNEGYSEVYEYSATTGSLTCASCDSSNAPPTGNAYIGATMEHHTSTPFYQPRVLSDEGGRLFFSSPDPLVAGVASPYEKVYEYEQDGDGSCISVSGCRYLISSGASGTREGEDVFLDASANGDDVYFGTLGRLAASDQDNLFDVYDARVDGGLPPPSTQAGCTEGCGSTPSTVAPASPPPASQLILSGSTPGSGNLAPPLPAKPRAKPKRLTCQARARKIKRAKARARALERCPRPKRAIR